MGSQNKQRVGRFGKNVRLSKTINQMCVGEIFYIYKKNFIKTDKGIFLSVNTKIIPTEAIDYLFPDLEKLIIRCVPIKRTNIGITQDDFYVDFTDIGYFQYVTKKTKYTSLVKNPKYIFFDIKVSQNDNEFIHILYQDDESSVVLLNENTDSIVLRELQQNLSRAINDEDYLKAAQIFEEIKILKEKQKHKK